MYHPLFISLDITLIANRDGFGGTGWGHGPPTKFRKKKILAVILFFLMVPHLKKKAGPPHPPITDRSSTVKSKKKLVLLLLSYFLSSTVPLFPTLSHAASVLHNPPLSLLQHFLLGTNCFRSILSFAHFLLYLCYHLPHISLK